MENLDTNNPAFTLEHAEVQKELDRLGLCAEEEDAQGISDAFDNDLAENLVSLMADGCEYPEAIAAQIAASRIMLHKATRLKEQFEANRH